MDTHTHTACIPQKDIEGEGAFIGKKEGIWKNRRGAKRGWREVFNQNTLYMYEIVKK